MTSFPRAFYVANTLEIFERLAWYGFFTLSSLYMTSPVHQGGLGFSDAERGFLQGMIPFLLYLFPVITGALADRYGYRRMFWISFIILCPGYYLLGQARDFWWFFFAFLAVAVGAACFKPVVVGTVSRSTHAGNRGLGFGIFYTMVNLGGFIGPFVAGYLRAISWDWVFIASSCWIALNMLILAVFFKEPVSNADATHEDSRSLQQVLAECQQVLGNGRLALLVLPCLIALMLWGKGSLNAIQFWSCVALWLLLNGFWSRLCRQSSHPQPWYKQPVRVGDKRFVTYLLILAGFWTVYNQLFFTLPLYIRDYVDTTDLVQWLNAVHPQLAAFLAPVNLVQLTEYLQQAGNMDVASWQDQLVNFKVAVPEAISAAAHQRLSAGDIDASALALQWQQAFRQINPEYIINLDFGAIILFQIFVSRAATRFASMPVIIAGTGLLTLACLLGGILHASVMGGFVACAWVLVWAAGEMLASPKSQEYVAAISPPHQCALYMGYYFISMAVGMLFAGLLSGWSYQWFARDLHQPQWMWVFFAAIGLLSSLALAIYNRKLPQRISLPASC
ncbi:MFS transporter [Simiduia agarivorans]|uniref:Transporter n=1 Tax=Simiduia agarivorans (strain DSM 21679 / JCM 13881 / BCRC 17597 / SA1) TaxID=1117647 RepID=K4KFW1_SIMAS|nr:MFS transporter [Simiduia agarivorans]AFU97969.1 transporter [Simiduia agarivorans SA1 = DSM 21679]